MTEEIIIDGCNVKDCRRRIGKNNYCRYYKRPCADNNYNCIWKQNMRLKQENEDFEILAKSLYKKIEELEKENEALAFRERLYKADYEASEQENEELNKKYTEVLNLAKQNADANEYCLQELEKENEKLKEKLENEEYNTCCECTNIQNQNDKYRSILEEIRELTIIGVNASQCNCGLRALADDILDKINEVLK